MKPSDYLESMEWLQATRSDIIHIMRGDTNGGVYVANQTDIDKAEKIIARVLTEVINKMSDDN